MELVAEPDDTRINIADNTEQPRPVTSFGELLHLSAPDRATGLIVGADEQIVHLGRGVGRYLHFDEGAPSYNLLTLVQPQLQADLQAALLTARQQGQIQARRAFVAIDGAVQQIDMSVQPLTEPAWARDHWLVLFQEVSHASAISGPHRPQHQHTSEQLAAAELSERQQAEKTLRLSEERYRTLFESIDEGFCVIDMIFDADNQPIDYRFLEINPVFEQQTGLVDALGKTMRELIPRHEQHWFDIYGNVALTGEPIRFERPSKELQRWFDLYAFRVGEPETRRVAVLFHDITERKRREMSTALLAEIQEEFARLSSADEIMRVVGQKIAAFFGFSLLTFTEVDPAANEVLVLHGQHEVDVTSPPSLLHLGDFLSRPYIEQLKAGRAIAIDDVTTDPDTTANGAAFLDLQICSLMLAPYLSDGRLKFILGGHVPQPHHWRADELELMSELAARVWLRLERGRTEAALRLSEERYRTLFESIDEGFCVIDMIFDADNQPIDYRFLEMNPAFERHTGLVDAIGRTARELVPNLEAFWFETYGHVALTGASMHFENRAEEMHRWFDVYASRVGDATSRKVALVFNDITERKQAEQALQASEQQSRNILASITDAFFAVDRDWRFTYLNQQAERLLEREPGDLLGKNLWESYPGLVGSEFEQIYRRAADKRIASSVTAFYPDHNRWYEVHAYPATNGMTGYFRNVTQRIEAEAALRESEERLRRAIAIETVGVIFFKPDGPITATNDAFLRMSGYTQADVASGLVRWDTQTPPEWMPHSIHAINEFLTQGRTTPYEKEYIRKDGSRWWGLFAATRINEAEGVEFVVDITENKRVAAERERLFHAAEQARREAEAALRTRDQFLSIASHELRTPLTSLMGYAHLLGTAVARGKGDLAKMASRITSQAQRLNALIEQLLDISRLQRGQFAIERRPIDLSAVAAHVVDEFRSSLPPDTLHPIEIHRPDAPVMIAGDAQRLEQVIQNLLSNAVKYSPAGGTVRVHVLHTTTMAELVIEDQGIGIPTEAGDHLFEPFYRADNVGEHVSGFGIGLHIVREIVQRHDGRIEVASTLGTGSCFRVLLPLQANDSSTQQAREPSV